MTYELLEHVLYTFKGTKKIKQKKIDIDIYQEFDFNPKS